MILYNAEMCYSVVEANKMVEDDAGQGAVGTIIRCDTLHTARKKVVAAKSSSTWVQQANGWRLLIAMRVSSCPTKRVS